MQHPVIGVGPKCQVPWDDVPICRWPLFRTEAQRRQRLAALTGGLKRWTQFTHSPERQPVWSHNGAGLAPAPHGNWPARFASDPLARFTEPPPLQSDALRWSRCGIDCGRWWCEHVMRNANRRRSRVRRCQIGDDVWAIFVARFGGRQRRVESDRDIVEFGADVCIDGVDEETQAG